MCGRVVLAAAPQPVCASVCISYLLLIQHQFISFITLSTMSGGSCSSDRLIKPKLSRVKTEDWGGEVSYSTDKISQYTACPYNSRPLTELQPTANSNRALAFDSDFVASAFGASRVAALLTGYGAPARAYARSIGKSLDLSVTVCARVRPVIKERMMNDRAQTIKALGVARILLAYKGDRRIGGAARVRDSSDLLSERVRPRPGR